VLRRIVNIVAVAALLMAFVGCRTGAKAASWDATQAKAFIVGIQQIAKSDPVLADKFTDALFSEYWVRACPNTVAYLPAVSRERLEAISAGTRIIGPDGSNGMKRDIERVYPNDGCRTAAVMIGRHPIWHRYLASVHPGVKLPPIFSGAR
jgi:hypothetical protein